MAREADDQERRVADELGEVLDQLEQRLLGPVDVLEHEHERLRIRELRGPLPRRPRDLLLRALALDGLEHARGVREQVGDGLVLAAGAKLLERLADGLVVVDACGDLDHLGERPVRDPLAVGQRSALEHGRALERLEELPREAALADAGLAEDRDEVRAPVAHDARVGVLEQAELDVAADQRGLEARDARAAVERGRAHATPRSARSARAPARARRPRPRSGRASAGRRSARSGSGRPRRSAGAARRC